MLKKIFLSMILTGLMLTSCSNYDCCIPTVISVAPGSVSIDGSVGAIRILTLDCDILWELQDLPSWLSATPDHSLTGGPVTVTLEVEEPNPGPGARPAITLTFVAANGDKAMVTVVQSVRIEALDAIFNISMVYVEGGSFSMGATDGLGPTYLRELPVHDVTLNSYYIGKYPVTQKQWKALMGNSWDFGFTGDDLPAERISWTHIVGTPPGESMILNEIEYFENGFIYKLNNITGRKYRLPTEAEWEYAARGGNQTDGYQYSGSDDAGEVAWYDEPMATGSTHVVGAKKGNELGIFDMSGNVFEWCSDWYDVDYYTTSPINNPLGPTFSPVGWRVFRGGCWYNSVVSLRVSFRNGNVPGNRGFDIGFRLVRID